MAGFGALMFSGFHFDHSRIPVLISIGSCLILRSCDHTSFFNEIQTRIPGVETDKKKTKDEKESNIIGLLLPLLQ